MKKISDERLEQMLTDYCEAECSQSFVYDPDRKKEKIIPFARFHKAAVAAASLVLVSVLSLTVYFLIGNKNAPLIVAPPSQSATTPSAPADGSGGDNAGQPDGTAVTESKSLWDKIADFLFPQPTESGSTAPTHSDPTEKNLKPTVPGATQPNQIKPTERAGEKPIEKPVQPTEKPVQPTVKPTEPAHTPTVPCDPPWNDEPTEGGSSPYPWEPEETQPPNEGSSPGDEPGVDPPTEGGVTGIAPPTVYATISSSLLGNDDERVYCKVYDNSGRRLGNANLYDGSHIATIVSRGQNVTSVEYDVPEGVITQPGFYNFVFYNNSGKLLAQVQEYCD